MAQPMIDVRNVAKQFGANVVLKQISLQLPAGRVMGLIGPSGAGKTTLVKAILGMEKVDSGTTTVLGTEMPNRQIMQKIGYMAQSDALYETLTARENLRFFGELMGVTGTALTSSITHVAQVVNLTAELNRRVSAYSGGMKRRLSLAIALIADPDLLILDEPTVGIDPELRQQIWAELRQLKQHGKAILVTTHVMDEAERCDELMLIREGIALAQGTPDDLKQEYAVDTIEQVFLKAGRLQDENHSDR
ncbi:ABC transporter ATP-binding protein [Levilactobacillus acidifarinae]|uniref:ABC superfamily ATP binding cassette transporter, ABC protein n=1 Tax=Levilactobacillus acidifarinae DSM 19394 = JCM 15949 TaxID=1423715 RepID=A0A0R1LI27_9LACO|nr:ABC transporter ATP-binding protein [Levilactobacillus acidifarinae]KRK95160.1 ABC superfamily ATP binding cassette transporter, ABC protein [Levilactobacillus acidifarinae DSM 19394]GEO70360.1 ABC transporter ATP-binding protein [Levilactobacillus acidifarinae]